MELPENKYEHWKAKFIDGLPPLFAIRVKTLLRNEHGEILYQDYTNGRLIGVCTQEGKNLCNELKLPRKLKIDKLRERSQPGDVCTQFGLPGISADSKKTKHRDSRGSNPDKPYRKRRYKHRHRSKEEQDEIKAYRKSNRLTKNRSKRELAKIKCYKCGNFGLIAPNCKLEKLKALELDEEVHDKVYSSEEEIELPESSDNNQRDNMNACNTCNGDTFLCDTLKSTKVQEKIKLISEQIDICADHPSAFCNQKKHIVTLPNEDNFSEDEIPTKSRPCQMNSKLVELCKKEIDNLLQKGLIKPSKSHWSCTAFYVNNATEKERGVPRMAPP
ncbi:uncharacterized protein LOC125869745 [Solanum stenotomum]|uniref:uncharacterized protein LOC125869745 n=1 Tax=Solanum stenotomum TaxID=172797 RepID=UPI0020CFF428|nr:uncharacterized protein LOC125869745 [Solanum stenotomum]